VTSDTSRSDLLLPSLGRGQQGSAPYSTQAGFLVSFIGGPVAGLGMALINARRLNRLPRDMAWLLLALCAYVALEWWLTSPGGVQWLQQVTHWLGRPPRSLILTVLGLLSFGLSSLLHGQSQRQATVMGLDRPSGTRLGLGLVVLGSLVSFGVERALR
jgi:hypothetical protein